MTTNISLHSPWCGAVFGGRALELAGRVVHPLYQGRGLATAMLVDLLTIEQPTFLTTYTRNPSILRMIASVSSEVYPITLHSMLARFARSLPNATEIDSVNYHINRYDEGGLFREGDPADRPLTPGGISLKEQFDRLTDVRNALVVVSRVRRDI